MNLPTLTQTRGRLWELTALALISADAFSTANAANWPTWRGPTGNGVSPDGSPPAQFSETENIKWKIEVPGEGHASPVIWGNQIFLMTAVSEEAVEGTAEGALPPPPPPAAGRPGPGRRGPGGPPPAAGRPGPGGQGPGFGPGQRPGRPPGNPPPRGPGRGFGGRGRGGFGGGAPVSVMTFKLLCYDKSSGELIWERDCKTEKPHEGKHPTNTFSSASAVTDGEVVIANFGSRGIYCFDLNGETLWSKDFGNMQTRNGFGEGSSPSIYGNKVVVLWDTEAESFVTALDKKTGEQIWKVDRDENTTWSTPYIVDAAGKTQVIVNATNKVRSYNLDNGSLIWECSGQTTNAIPSPVVDREKGVAYVVSGYRGSSAYAIQLDGSGDVSTTDKVLWTYNRGTPYVPSPLLYNGRLYFLQSNDRILTCVDAASGKVLYSQERLDGGGGVYSSPVAADGRVYISTQDGSVLTLKDGETLETIAVNSLDEPINASPAIVGSDMFIRTSSHLYCISSKDS